MSPTKQMEQDEDYKLAIANLKELEKLRVSENDLAKVCAGKCCAVLCKCT
jgi:hypothetical protein